MDRLSVRRLGLALFCGVVGLALNALPGTAVAPLLLGRVITLQVAILFGPVPGLLSAVIGALALIPAANLALFAIGFLSLEAALTGAFAVRGKSPLVAGALLWGGLSLLLFLSPRLLGLESLRQTLLPLALQMPLNGLVAVVAAALIATSEAARRLAAH